MTPRFGHEPETTTLRDQTQTHTDIHTLFGETTVVRRVNNILTFCDLAFGGCVWDRRLDE